MPQHVRVVPPDPAWAEGYRRERALLMPVFGPLLVELHHIGSTAVEGLWAKPILDLMPVVTSLEAVDRLDPELEALGYQCMGEFGIPGRRYFRKGGDHRTHQLHVFQAGDRKNILRHLAVRDYLRACPAGGLWGAEAVAGRTVPGGHGGLLRRKGRLCPGAGAAGPGLVRRETAVI